MNTLRHGLASLLLALVSLWGCQAEPPRPAAIKSATTTTYLTSTLNVATLNAFYTGRTAGMITKADIVRVLTSDAGIAAFDAQKLAYVMQNGPAFLPTPAHQAAFANELVDNQAYFFAYLGFPVTLTNLQLVLQGQGGLTAAQYLAYLRVGFGDGRCGATVAGTAGCEATVANLQQALTTNLNLVFNIRTNATIDNKYENTFAINRESISYRKLFDYVAQHFGGHAHNPLRDYVLDVSSPTTADCLKLTSMFENGATLNAYVVARGAPAEVGTLAQHQLDGVTEVTGRVTYYYGLFYFLRGENCSRINFDPVTCYRGDPALLPRVQARRPAMVIPASSSAYSWSCQDIAALIDVTGSLPFADAYDGVRRAAEFPFDNIDNQLTAEDVLAFVVGLGNGNINRPDAPFIDNIPAADAAMLVAAGIDNSEFEFQSRMVPHIFQLFGL